MLLVVVFFVLLSGIFIYKQKITLNFDILKNGYRKSSLVMEEVKK